MLQKYFNATCERETLRAYVELKYFCIMSSPALLTCAMWCTISPFSPRKCNLFSLLNCVYTMQRLQPVVQLVVSYELDIKGRSHYARIRARPHRIRCERSFTLLLLELPFCDRDRNRSGRPAPVAGRVGSTLGDRCVTGRQHKMQKDTFFN